MSTYYYTRCIVISELCPSLIKLNSESMHTISVTLHVVEQTDLVVCVSGPAAQQTTSLIVL